MKKPARMVLGVLVATVLGGTAACAESGHTDGGLHPDPGGDVAGSTYVVTAVTEGDTARTLVPGTQVRLRFADGRLTVTAGCNTMTGGYSLDGDALTVEPMAMTEMGCDPARMAQDTWVAGLLSGTVRLTSGASATLTSGPTVLTLADREAVSPDRPLVDTRWRLDTIGTGDGPSGSASSVPRTARAFLVLRQDGRFRASWACGSAILGTAAVTGDEITWTETSRTLAHCDRGHAGSGEAAEAFEGLLAGRATYRVVEDRLTLTHAGGGLGFGAR